MIDVITPPTTFAVGDMVRPAESADLHYHLTGQRTPPGEIVGITEHGAHMVRHGDGSALPYGPHELEKADD